jgi:DNA-binding CsgD family transcriptional regulator
VLVEGATSSSLSLLRSAEYTEPDLEFVRHLMPHLARALQYHQRFSDLERTRQSAADALERLPIGVMLLDASGRVLLANRAARAILDLDDGLSLQAKRPVAALHTETLRLRRFITTALTRGAAHDGAGGALSVSRPSHRRPFEVLVTPLGESAAGDLGHGAATAALFLSDPERAVQADAGVLQQLYGLTRTEARVATGLAGGLSIREIAEANAMTMNTARWHAKNVFAKTDTAGQSDLVRLVVTGPASVRPSPS